MTTDQLNHLVARLEVSIPAPRPPKAKPRKVWKKLKVGDMLVHRDDGTGWFVKALDSTGATLEGLEDHPTLRSLTEGGWEDHYMRVKVPRKRKEV